VNLCRSFIPLVTLLVGTGSGFAAELPFDHKYLAFAIAYRATDSAGGGGNFVVLGHYDFLDNHELNLSYFFYDGRRNLKSNATSQQHPRLVAGTAATPGAIQIPAYTLAENVRGTWSVDRAGGILRMRLGNTIHEWSLRSPADNLFVPRGPYLNADTNTPTVSGWTYSDARGYAYLTDYVTLPRKITRADLLPDYKGEIQSLITPRGGASQWTQKLSDLHVQRYQSFADGDVLGYMVSSRWVSTPMVVFSTLLLNYAPHSKLLIYSNGGHDFNRNGVFDEPGHTTQMFGIYDGAKISRLVYIEHSYQDAGLPILSVGHYYPPAPAAAAAAK
jgi:hypothetical protein